MHLHRGFSDADIVGNLLVQATGHDMEHDLSFPRAEAIESLPQCSQRLVPLPSGAIASESALDGLNEVVITERFCQELYGTALHRLHGHRHVRVRSDEDDGYLPVRCRQVSLKV